MFNMTNKIAYCKLCLNTDVEIIYMAGNVSVEENVDLSGSFVVLIDYGY